MAKHQVERLVGGRGTYPYGLAPFSGHGWHTPDRILDALLVNQRALCASLAASEVDHDGVEQHVEHHALLEQFRRRADLRQPGTRVVPLEAALHQPLRLRISLMRTHAT